MLGEIISKVLAPLSGRIKEDGIHSSILSMQFPEYHITTSTIQEEILSWGLDPDRILGSAGLVHQCSDDLLSLSRGELKRLHLACLLAGNYDLIVLDEPFAGLDEDARYWISSLIDDRQGGITIIISHDITTLPRIDHLWEMENGELICIGPVPASLSGWKSAPPLIRYLLTHHSGLNGLSWKDLTEAICRIHG